MSTGQELSAADAALEAHHDETVKFFQDILAHPEATDHDKSIARDALAQFAKLREERIRKRALDSEQALGELAADESVSEETRRWAQKALDDERRHQALKAKLEDARRLRENPAKPPNLRGNPVFRHWRTAAFFAAAFATAAWMLASRNGGSVTNTMQAPAKAEATAAASAEPTPVASAEIKSATDGHAKVKSASREASFETCVQTIQSFAAQADTAPENLVETNILRIVRFETSDGYVLVTCSRPDNKMTVTTHTK